MKGNEHLRSLIAQEAARLMYEEGIKEYRDAKRKAARHFGARGPQILGSHLPSNAEIHAELRRLLELHEEKVLPERLLALRLQALRYLELFAPFSPYLVGSVLSGVVRKESDIDLHLFAEAAQQVEEFLHQEGISYELEVVCIRKGSEFYEFPHIYIEEEGTIIECTVYPPEERPRVPKSSITGKAMARATARTLRALISEMLEGSP